MDNDDRDAPPHTKPPRTNRLKRHFSPASAKGTLQRRPPRTKTVSRDLSVRQKNVVHFIKFFSMMRRLGPLLDRKRRSLRFRRIPHHSRATDSQTQALGRSRVAVSALSHYSVLTMDALVRLGGTQLMLPIQKLLSCAGRHSVTQRVVQCRVLTHRDCISATRSVSEGTRASRSVARCRLHCSARAHLSYSQNTPVIGNRSSGMAMCAD